MRFFLFGLTALFAALFVTAPVAAADTNRAGPDLPFERYFAAAKNRFNVLKFNDFSGKIEAARIKKLLRSGNILGDRVLLNNNAAVYFPDGYIVSYSIRLEKWLAKTGLRAEQVNTSQQVEPNPDYVLTGKIEEQLGHVCAEVQASNPHEKVRLRKSKSGVLSLIKRTAGRFDHIVGAPSETVLITSALEPQFLSPDQQIRQAVQRCI